MESLARKAMWGLLSGMAVLLAACGGGGGNSSGGSGNPTTPAMTVTPGSNSISIDQPLQVTAAVAGTPTPTGSVRLSSGNYSSSAATLSGGSATITVPAGSLPVGTSTLTATYTPDAGSTSAYTSATKTAQVSVTVATPTVSVTPASTSVGTGQALSVTVAVAGFSGGPTPSGSVTLTAGTFISGATALTNGSATFSVPGGSMAVGTATLSATYSPDTAGAATYASASKTTTVTVTTLTPSTVTVNQGSPIAAVSDQLLGTNLESWYDNVGHSTAINTAFGKAGIKAIRWPGGSWSDGYHWGYQPGSGSLVAPYNCHCTTTNGVTQCTANSKDWAGYSSFAEFVTALPLAGSYDLALTANYGVNETCDGGGDPAEAAAWVNAAIGNGVTVSHMTVGNENYGNWENDLHASPHDPTTYANSVIGANGYYHLIRAASPSTSVGVVVNATGTQSGWDKTVLSAAKGSYDFVEYHYYPQYQDVTSDTYLVHQAALDFANNINTIKSELTAAGNAGTIPIYVGEVGSNSANPGTQSFSITGGLFAGQMLGESMNAGIARLTWWDSFGNCFGAGNNSPLLYGWQLWGSQSIFSDGPTETNCPNAGPIGTMSPTARAFELFSNIAMNGESALSTSVTGDSNIRAYSATHSGGTALFLFNLDQNVSHDVTIKLSGGSTSSSDVQVITYDKAIYDRSNPANTGGAVWADPATVDLGAKNLPLTITLTPWSMNVVIIK